MAAAAAEANLQPSPQTITITVPSSPEIESAPPAPEGTDHEDTQKALLTVTSVLTTVSLGILIAPLSAGTPRLLVIAHHTALLLAFFLGLAVLMHSIFRPAGPEAARRQKEAIAIGYSLLFAGAVLYFSVRRR